MAAYIIPLTPEPQSFGITLAGRELRLTVRWFEGGEAGWLLDVAEPDSTAALVCGIPLVSGCDLFGPYSYLDFGGALVLDGDVPPALEALGVGVNVCFITSDDGGGEA